MAGEPRKAVYTVLSGSTAVTALVSTRIYPVLAPQDTTLPYVTYQRGSLTPYQSMTESAGLLDALITVSCWGETWPSVSSVADAVRTALKDKKGAIGTGATAQTVERMFLEDERDDAVLLETESGFLAVYNTDLDFRVVVQE